MHDGRPVDAANAVPATLRAFVAAAVSEPVRARLAETQARLKAAGAGVGWVAPGNLHLTLVFLGDLFESAATAFGEAAQAAAARHAPFAGLDLRGLGTFGNPRAPKVVWAGLAGDLQPLLALQADLADAARGAGIRIDARPFHPHLTLGRVRSARRARDLVEALAPFQDTVFGPLAVDRVLLMQSRLGPQGPTYTCLRECRLGRP